MAFFCLTQLGVQDPIKSALRTDNNQPNSAPTSKPEPQQGGQSPSKPSSEAQGSYVKYTERLTKHQRTAAEPNEIYQKPVTSSHEYGWWKQDGAPENLRWTNVDRHARVNSEMTRFVDEMTLTNKHFTLF